MAYTIDIEKIKEQPTGNQLGFITKSGVYDITIRQIYFDQTVNGAEQAVIVYSLPHALDKTSRLFMTIKSTKGIDTFAKPILDSLLYLIGIKDVTVKEQEIVTGKTRFTAECIQNVDGKQVSVWVMQKFRKWNNEIKEQLDVKEFFDIKDKATARERITGKDIGKRFENSKPSHGITGYDKCTEAEVKKYIEARQASRDSASSQQTSAKVTEDDDLPF